MEDSQEAAKIMGFIYKRAEINIGKRQNCWFQAFSPLLNNFSKVFVDLACCEQDIVVTMTVRYMSER